ncbi:MAG: NAD(P)(+) transhydrogenase (Re/Si-specific) subunit beta, partial [Aquiluna sp.]
MQLDNNMEKPEEVEIRRAPKVLPWAITGAVIGLAFAALLYLVSGVFFILALRGLSSPERSRRGNMFGIAGMTVAVVTTLLYAA